MTKRLFASAVLAGLVVAGAPARAEVYGLVVGIDDYIGTNNDLAGAVNDARDIAQALKKAGAARVITLVDDQATKDTIVETWNALVGLAKKGDTIVFSYAGHGGQEPEPPGRNGEEDGLNENFLLAKYQPTGIGTRERIVDDEIFEWLTAAEAKGITVVLVADSCHSGTMNRSASAEGVKFRKGNFPDLDLKDDLLTLPPPDVATMTEDKLETTTFIGATLESRLTPEINIDGHPRGALSWAFSRALEGAADRNKDGDLTQFELLSFLVPAVQSQAEGQQTPQISPLRPEDIPLFRKIAVEAGPAATAKPDGQTAAATGTSTVKPAETPASADAGKLKLFIEGAPEPQLAMMTDVVVTKDVGSADLIWKRSSGVVEHRIGGPVAEDIASFADIQPVLGKWVALGFLKHNAGENPATLKVKSGDQTYHRGERVHVEMTPTALPYLTMFNLPPNGRVEFFLPASAREAEVDYRERTFSERFEVKDPPFGAEHLVAILTEEPMPGLHAALKAMPTADKARGLGAALRSLLEGKKFQVGIAAIYTSGDKKNN